MDFPITDPLDEQLDEQQSQQWFEQHFHPDGLHCPRCQASREEAYLFRRTRSSRLEVYRCRECGQTYNLHSGTVFAHRQFTAPQVVLLLRGVFQGQSSSHLARELQMSRTTIHEVRQAIQHQAAEQSPQTPLPDKWTETDEMFQNAGKKGERHPDPDDPPRRRANKRRGHGTYENDRPPIIGTIGHTSGQVRLRVIHHTDKPTLSQHLQTATRETSRVCTDDWRGYSQGPRQRQWVCHSQGEWARDDNGDGIREVHTNTIEGTWTTVRNFLRPFRGVHKRYLAGYVDICELRTNFKQLSPRCVARLVSRPSSAH